MQKFLTGFIYTLTALSGVLAFAYPFLWPVVGGRSAAPLLTMLLLAACLLILLLEVQGALVSAKTVALLGILVSLTSVLRYIEVAIPGPGGFTPIFVPIILTGYVFGSRLGFLMGAMTLLVSALITGGVGVWLPYQMFTAGWMGLTAGWLPAVRHEKVTLLLLLIFSFGWGLLYGGVMNLYSWPLMVGDPAVSWQNGLSWAEGVQRYWAFYLLTSLVWDVFGALGNGLLMLFFGLPALRVLRRFYSRFYFTVAP